MKKNEVTQSIYEACRELAREIGKDIVFVTAKQVPRLEPFHTAIRRTALKPMFKPDVVIIDYMTKL